jgi:GTPase SAR1 family protein
VRSFDAVVVLYSITDRVSFHAAREALDLMAEANPPVAVPVLLLANKTDLSHLRKVSTTCNIANFLPISLCTLTDFHP